MLFELFLWDSGNYIQSLFLVMSPLIKLNTLTEHPSGTITPLAETLVILKGFPVL